MQNFDKNKIIKYFKKYIPIDSKILDVGCGIGENLSLISELKYKNIIGVDISDEMVEISKKKGFVVYTVKQLQSLNTIKDIDVIIFSHILEHINYPEIQNVMEFYFSLCKKNAKIVILMPLLYDAFFNDVDHIKPYYPNGLIMLFSENIFSKQYASKYKLELIDIHFRKNLLISYNIRSSYIKTTINKIKIKIITIIMKLLFFCSFKMISKTTGYIAIFGLKKLNS